MDSSIIQQPLQHRNLSENDLKEDFVKLLLIKLEKVTVNAAQEFIANKKKFGIGYCVIDELLPEDKALQIFSKFEPTHTAWRQMNSFRERKLTTKQYDQFDPILKAITFSFQDHRVIGVVERITSIAKQIPDQHLYAGGLSLMRPGDFLDPHIDNSHDQFQKVYRRLNLLYYVTPNWKPELGGSLELWDTKVKNSVTIPSLFNRLVLMETHDYSWHSVSKVIPQTIVNDLNQNLGSTLVPNVRCCVSNYYFSEESPTGGSYYHVTSFMARPNQPIKRIFCRIDNRMRSFLRAIKRSGFGKKDLYTEKA